MPSFKTMAQVDHLTSASALNSEMRETTVEATEVLLDDFGLDHWREEHLAEPDCELGTTIVVRGVLEVDERDPIVGSLQETAGKGLALRVEVTDELRP